MKISIITSCYNREATIRHAIESVLAQDYPDIEYIIVDGASKDNTMRVVNEYSDRVARIICEPDHGMYEAINKGIKVATGEVVGLLHSDDSFFDNQVVSRIVEKLEQTGADLLYGNGLFVNAERKNRVVRTWHGGIYRTWKVRHGWLPLHPTCYIRREVMQYRGLYNETYKIAADSDLLLRYLMGGDITVTYLDEYIVRMRMGGLSTDRARRRQMWQEDVRMYHSHGLNPVVTKVEKMLWKLPQFVLAKFMKSGIFQ